MGGTRLFNNSDGAQAWTKPLFDGSVAILLYNRGNFSESWGGGGPPVPVTVDWTSLGWDDEVSSGMATVRSAGGRIPEGAPLDPWRAVPAIFYGWRLLCTPDDAPACRSRCGTSGLTKTRHHRTQPLGTRFCSTPRRSPCTGRTSCLAACPFPEGPRSGINRSKVAAGRICAERTRV